MARPQNIARVALLTVAALAAASAPAWGFVRKQTDAGRDEYWQVNCIPISVYINDFGDMTRDEVAKSIAAAAHAWSPSEVTCGDGLTHPFVEIVPSLAAANTRAPRPAYDGHNTLQFYTPYSPYPENTAFNSSIIALTSVWARADGHIVDADVQVNALDNQFANLDPGYVPPDGYDRLDLQNAVTHEFGHLIGLGHTCWDPFSDFDQPVDDMDAGVPLCYPAPDVVKETVMFATIAGNGETTKRFLKTDDIRGVCSIYPASGDPQSCALDAPDDGCGCATASSRGRDGGPLALVVAIAAALALRRRRAPRSERR
jgi:MYXO-CTERM domain-containing protein